MQRSRRFPGVGTVVLAEYLAAAVAIVVAVWVAIARYQPPRLNCGDCLDGPPAYVLEGLFGTAFLALAFSVSLTLLALWRRLLLRRGAAPTRGGRALLVGTALVLCGQIITVAGFAAMVAISHLMRQGPPG